MNVNLAYQEEIWDEMINGRIVMMSPRPTFNHNQIASNIYRIFANYLDNKSCTAIADGTELFLNETNRFIPDMMIVCDREKIKFDGVHGSPDFVAEVLSPRTAKYDKGAKKEAYAQSGVKEYWIVDPANKSVEQYLLQEGRLVLQDIYTIPPEYFSEEEAAKFAKDFKCSLYDDLTITLTDIFKRVI